jgi:hypothetical protein
MKINRTCKLLPSGVSKRAFLTRSWKVVLQNCQISNKKPEKVVKLMEKLLFSMKFDSFVEPLYVLVGFSRNLIVF